MNTDKELTAVLSAQRLCKHEKATNGECFNRVLEFYTIKNDTSL